MTTELDMVNFLLSVRSLEIGSRDTLRLRPIQILRRERLTDYHEYIGFT